MAITFPSERMSWVGFAQFVCGALGIPVGVLLLQRAGALYVDRTPPYSVLVAVGFGALILAGAGAYGLVRRGEYPWLVALAAIALPLFEPSVAPYTSRFRVVVAIRDVLLLAALAWWIVRALGSTDELERRIHLQALAFSYAAAVVALTVSAESADVVALRGSWIASAMLATWFVSWLILALRYQR